MNVSIVMCPVKICRGITVEQTKWSNSKIKLGIPFMVPDLLCINFKRLATKERSLRGNQCGMDG